MLLNGYVEQHGLYLFEIIKSLFFKTENAHL